MSNNYLFSKTDLIQLGYPNNIVNQYGTFIFDISWSVWSSQKPKKYPIINTLQSFNDLSINQITNLKTRITTVTIKWSSFTDYNSNDGISLNPYIFPFYNEPSLNIRQFGGIPLTRNSVNNSYFWQFYKFGGSISANDTPTILKNTNLTNCFRNSTCKLFNNVDNWNIYQAINVNSMFTDAIYFNKDISDWNYSNVKNGDAVDILYNTNYNSLNSATFLENIASNRTINYYNYNNNISFNIGKIQNYLDTSNVRFAISTLNKRRIIFEISGTPIEYDVTKFKSLGYSVSDLKKEGFPITDLIGSGYSSYELNEGGYSINQMQSLNKFELIDYINARFSLQELVNAGYNAYELRINNYNALEYYKLNPKYNEHYLKQVFTLNTIINTGYDLYDIKKMGYSLQEISQSTIFNNYTILDYKKIGYSASDIINVGLSLDSLIQYDPLPQVLKDNSFNVVDFKIVNYDIYKILNLKYSLRDLYDASYSVLNIQNDLITNNIRDISFSILDYKKAGFSLQNITNGGFVVDNIRNYSPLPQILKDNNLNAIDLKNAGYSINVIYYTFKYTGLDIKNAGFSLKEMKNIGLSVHDLKYAGFTASELLNS